MFCLFRLPVLEAVDRDDMDDPNSNNNNQGQGPGTRWFTMSHIETQQYELGAMMISAARGLYKYHYKENWQNCNFIVQTFYHLVEKLS